MVQSLALPLLMLIPNMHTPECVVYDAGSGYIYVSNVVGEGWANDEKGFIARLKSDGSVDRLHWRTKTPEARLSAPKGMCILHGWLYVGDNARLARFSLTGTESQSIAVPDADHINDLATDGVHVWASDTTRGVIYRVTPDLREVKRIPGVPMINGIAFGKGRMWAVGWEPADLYEIDPSGVKAPRPFGLTKHFTNLDTIEVMPGGSFLVTDFGGNKVSVVSADEKEVRDVAEVKNPADAGVDLKGRRLFVPSFTGDTVSVFSLK